MQKSIFLTGANRGIGLELARCFAAEGWRVLASCRVPEQAADLQVLAEESEMVRILPLDVTDAGQLHQVAEALAGQPIDILVNNAGIIGPRRQGLGETDEAWWLEMFRVNTIAPMKVIEALLENVAASRHKVIASVGSLLGSLTDNTSGGMYLYRTSKAALHMVMRGLAADLRNRGVISVALHPGWVRTRIGGLEAPLTPQESAAGLCRVLLGLNPSDSGKLFTYEGKELPF